MTGLLDLRSRPVAAEPPPETTRLRIVQAVTSCYAPQYIAEELLQGEGFAEVQYVKVVVGGAQKALDTGEIDLSFQCAGPLIISVGAGNPIVMLAGGTSAVSNCSGTTGSGRFAT